MSDISDLTHEQLPSNSRLIKATIIAILIALVVLVVAVLPAEYGVDPTGLGEKLGLSALAEGTSSTSEKTNAKVELKTNTADSKKNHIFISEETYQSKELSIQLLPRQGMEVKAVMDEGALLIYNWNSTGDLYMDMHGEEFNAAPDEFTSYWEEGQINKASGYLVANFSGTHGWYWENKTNDLIDISIEISGFYKDVYIP